jgi:hypothetical protein
LLWLRWSAFLPPFRDGATRVQRREFNPVCDIHDETYTLASVKRGLCMSRFGLSRKLSRFRKWPSAHLEFHAISRSTFDEKARQTGAVQLAGPPEKTMLGAVFLTAKNAASFPGRSAIVASKSPSGGR